MRSIESSIPHKTFQSSSKIPRSWKRGPVNFHRQNLFRYCLSPMAIFRLILFSFGGVLPDGRSITAYSSTFSFFVDCYFLRAMRVDRCEHHACVSGLRQQSCSQPFASVWWLFALATTGAAD